MAPTRNLAQVLHGKNGAASVAAESFACAKLSSK
jgi:hypothetical protein